jgi:hypothetical protein
MSWTEFHLEAVSTSEELNPSTGDVVKGEEQVLAQTHLKHFQSSTDVHRTFCGKCGTHLTFWLGSAENVVPKSWGPYFNIAAGSIIKENGLELLVPGRELNVEDAVGWVKEMVRGGDKIG